MAYPATKTDWPALTIKFDPEVDQLIAATAKEDCRTKSDQVRFICRWYFNEREKTDDRVDS